MMSKVKLYGFLTFIFFIEFSKFSYAFRVFDSNGVETILAFENEDIAIKCKTDLPMSYCGFLHPNGRRYSFTDLNDGNCALKINATKADVGEWKCHIGTKANRVETMKTIKLRVVEQIAAVQANLTAMHGKSVTLACVTTKGLVPLIYCRFEPPIGSPFNIDSTVNASNPISNKYYFPPNKSLDRGDCAVTIRKVKYDDAGIWTCGVGLDDEQEHTDRIQLEVKGAYTLSNASVAIITIGSVIIALTIGFLGYSAWKRRWFLGSRQQVEGESVEIQELRQQQIPHSTPHVLPHSRRVVPKVVVQSPSDSSDSPVSST